MSKKIFQKENKKNLAKTFVFLLVFLGSNLVSAQKQKLYFNTWIDFNKNGLKDIYEDPENSTADRVENLLSLMNMEEKTCQMVTLYGYGRVLKDELPTKNWKNEIWKDGIGNIDEQLANTTFRSQTSTVHSYPYSNHAKAINTIQKWFIEETRLGIPVDFTIEGIRGLAHDRATCFPANIGMGSTWNKALINQMGQIIGKEAQVLGYTNVYAPILDLARDPRWGRTVESFGEDPFLVAELGVQESKGIQKAGVASTLKHYAVYSVPAGGRDGEARTNPQVTFREMHNINLYPFSEVIQRAAPLGVMSSYNDYDGIPVSGSDYFLRFLLRNEYHFKGYIVSDSDAVEFLETKHKVAKEYKDAIRQCVEAGVNVRTNFTPPEVYVKPLRQLINDGELAIETIDQCVREILTVKFELGLFDHPFIENPAIADSIVRNQEHVKTAKQASYESLVLLKNENNFLPLNKDKVKSILVVGENAMNTEHSLSRYGPNNVNIISVFDGIKNKIGDQIEVDFAKGCSVETDNLLNLEMYFEEPNTEQQQLINEAVEKAKINDLALVVLGDNNGLVGESKSRTSLNLSGYQEHLLRELYKTGTPIVLVLINGRPITINWADEYIPAILEAWFPGEFGGQAIADALFGDYNPGGKLPVTFPRSVGQIPYAFPFKPGSRAGQGNGISRIIDGLYPFGFGLSYTTFEYTDLQISPTNIHANEQVNVTCKVKNTGSYEGDEVVQLYFSDEVSSVTVYEKQLRGFERIHLKPGEIKEIKFTLDTEDFALINKDMKKVTEKGNFKILIGSSSEDIRLEEMIKFNESIIFKTFSTANL